MTPASRGGTSSTSPKARVAKARSATDRPPLELAPKPAAFDFLESKVQVPKLRPGTVSRTALVNRLRATTAASVATLAAPAGYGKTTLLAQWAERETRPFAWLTLDERDNDPVVLLRHMVVALERDEPVEQGVIDALRSPRTTVWARALPRLAAELAARSPIVLVLDDFNALRSKESLEVVRALIDDEAEGSLLVVAGRVPPRLPLAPLRVTGRLVELYSPDLALTKREAKLLLRATGIRLSDARTDELIEQCEGWAAALYLAALSIRDGEHTGAEPSSLRGDDRYLADYFRSEYLSRLRPGALRFLRRTSVLDRMCGPLCDAVLRDQGSAQELERIERANLFVVPLDNRRLWYRYHHLFRELLQRELAENEPKLVPILHGRAANWFEKTGDRQSALEHAYAAGDIDRAAEILAAIAFPLYYSGRVATLEHWLKRFERPELLERYPAVALHGSRVHALRGRREQAECWLEAGTRGTVRGPLPDGSSSIRPWIALMRAWLCREGAKQMLADAKTAVAGLAPESNWRPSALAAEGSALMMLGQSEEADTVLAAAAECAAALGSTETQILALGERALLAADIGDRSAADAHAEEVHRLVVTSDVEGAPALATEHAATARMLLRHGRWNEARTALEAARELTPFVNLALPWLAVRLRLELARGLITLRDTSSAQELLDETADLLKRAPGLGVLTARADQLRQEVELLPERDGIHHGGLTPAELRLLPLLATHLSFREIADQLYVSRNTIKTQAISVYRKLGVSSRSDAIAEARRLGLGEHLQVVISNER